MIALLRMVTGTPWILIGVLVAGVGTFGFYKGWSIEHERAVAIDLQWQLKLERANHAAEQEAYRRVQEAAEAAAAVAPAGPAAADIERLCDQDPACRDKR
jgi:hypothetical protein